MIGVAFVTHRIVTTDNTSIRIYELFTYTFLSLVFMFILLIGHIEFVPNFGKVVVW